MGAAAAAAVNVDFSSALAGITPGAALTSGGPVTVHSTLESDPDALATSANVDTGVGVGISLAANLSNQVNQASVGGTVTAAGIDVGASLGGDGIAHFFADAISGDALRAIPT